ncbi:FecR family protein [Spirosoma koreense]
MEDFSGYFRQAELIARHLRGELSRSEQEELDNWIRQNDRNRALFKKLTDEGRLNAELEQFVAAGKTDAWDRIATESGFDKTGKLTYIGHRLIRYGAAALVLLVSGLLIYQRYYKAEPTRRIAQRPIEIAPGSNKAILTLADASQIVLDEATNGEIARQADIVITKTADGQLVYNHAGTAAVASDKQAFVYNTITTPRGGKFRVVLPDGSRVWLNAASSLRYPTKFSSRERKVELRGEAYFEITHATSAARTSLPFRVHSTGQVVEVLGTHFNVNSYTDETSTKTTLLEGKVKVIKALPAASAHPNGKLVSALILKPGEQAQLTSGGSSKINLVRKVDIEEAVAWKNGQFQFKDTDLPTIMRQIARWYDVEVGFQGKIPDTKFRGKISRDVPLTQVFQILQLSGVNFKIEGRKITVRS